MNEIIKRGRGRPSGVKNAPNYVEVTAADIYALLGETKARVRVNKDWAEAIGLVGQPVSILTGVLPPVEDKETDDGGIIVHED